MKDAYSFHVDDASLRETYQVMYDTYARVFTRTGLEFRAVAADSGAIGGNVSHEFHVLAASGEDAIAFSSDGEYAANVEMVATLPSAAPRPAPTTTRVTVATPGKHSIDEVAGFLKVAPRQCVKTIIVRGAESEIVALVLRGDHALNAVKAEKLPQVATPLRFATAEQIKSAIGCGPGSLGPVGLKIPVIVDHAAAALADFICGANAEGAHLRGVNWGRDLPEPDAADLRNVVDGDPAPVGNGRLAIKRGIEVGHIFQLGTKYSAAMNATCLDDQGRSITMTMGCYGIGVSRIVAAAVEQNHDERGIIWPDAIAPFSVALLPMNMHKSQRLRDAAERLYDELKAANIDVLFDDRKERAGVMFADIDLIGIPHRLVLGERGLDANTIEYKGRRDTDSRNVPLDSVVAFLKSRFAPADK